MRQPKLSLRQAGRPRTRPGPVADAHARRQDGDAADSAACRSGDPDADCRVSALPATDEGVCGGQQCAVRGPTGSRPRADRRGGGESGVEEELAAALDNEIDTEIEALAGARAADEQDFEALAHAARRQALEAAARAVARRLNADRTDYADPTVACACGQTARYAGRRPTTFTTVLAPLALEHSYYHCGACRTGICPCDRALGLHATSLSPGVLRMLGLAPSDFSFAAASDMLWELARVRVETKQVERCAKALGREVAADERDVAEPVPGSAPTIYLGLDGTGVPVRPTEVEGRRGKQPDGSAKDPRGQAGHHVDGRNTRQGGPAGARPRVGQLQRRGRERGLLRCRPVAVRLRPRCLSRGATARLRHRGRPGRHR